MLTKLELVYKISERIDRGVPLKTLDAIISAYYEIIGEALIKGETVRLINLGSLSVVKVKKRKHYDLCKQKITTVPAHKAVRFRIFKNLKNKLKGKKA